MRCFLPPSLLFYHRGGEIWVKEKVQHLKTINALFLGPHTRCYVMFASIYKYFIKNLLFVLANKTDVLYIIFAEVLITLK